MINLDDKDHFGTPWRDSYVPAFELLALIESLGMTVAIASEHRKKGDLPEFVLDAWRQYDDLNERRFAKDLV